MFYGLCFILQALLEGRANGSDYFFLCEKPQRLLLPFAHTGQHKLWKLDGRVAKRAMAALQPCEQMPISFESHAEVSRALSITDPNMSMRATLPVGVYLGESEDEPECTGSDTDDQMLQLALALSLSDQSS